MIGRPPKYLSGSVDPQESAATARRQRVKDQETTRPIAIADLEEKNPRS
jgi:hypothetical protein